MLEEKQIVEMLAADYAKLKKFVAMETTNIYQNTVIDIHTLVVRMSTLLEVLTYPIDEYAKFLSDVLMPKLQKKFMKKGE